MQVTQATAARYIVLWRVIRVVDTRALVIDFPLLLSVAAGWTSRTRLALSTRKGQIYPAFSVLR